MRANLSRWKDRRFTRADALTRRAVAESFAGPAARLTSWFRLAVVPLLALIGPVVEEPRLNVPGYRSILAGYAVWAVLVAWWARRRRVPPSFGVVSTAVDLLALVLLTAVGNGPTSYLQPFFLIQPIIVILQLRPRLTAAVGLFIAGGYAAIWIHNLGINGGPGDHGVVWLHFGLLVWVAAATTASTSFLVNRSAAVLDLMRSRQKVIADSVTVEDRHRGRIAEELHDGPLQNAIAARRNLEDLADLLPGHPLLDQTDRLLRDTAAALRGTVTVLHPQVLAQMGLSAALRELADQHTANGRLTVHTDIDDVGYPQNQGLLYSAARELLVNVDRHAGAAQVWLTLRALSGRLRLMVEDDGIGMAVASAAVGHLGLATHQIRVSDAGGTLEVSQGTKGDDASPGVLVCVELPDQTHLRSPLADPVPTAAAISHSGRPSAH